MKDYFERPAVFYGAQTKKGLNWFLELLTFIAVMFVASMAEAIIIIPATIGLLFSDPDLIPLLQNGDVEKVQSMAQDLLSNDYYAIAALFATGMAILLTILFCKYIQKRKPSSLGFRKSGLLKEYFWGMLWGFVLFSLAVIFCIVTGSLKITGLAARIPVGIIVLYFLGYLVQGMSEETLFRGYLMGSVARRYALPIAILLNAGTFAAFHLANDGITVLAFINLVLFGTFASIYFIKRGSIWGIAALHSVWNFAQGNLYGIQVSGNQFSSSILTSEMVGGHEVINGGSFGLEGGLGVTITLVVGIVILCFMKGKVNHDEIEQEKNIAAGVFAGMQVGTGYQQ